MGEVSHITTNYTTNRTNQHPGNRGFLPGNRFAPFKEAPGERGMAAIAEHGTNEAQLTKAGEEWTAGQT